MYSCEIIEISDDEDYQLHQAIVESQTTTASAPPPLLKQEPLVKQESQKFNRDAVLDVLCKAIQQGLRKEDLQQLFQFD